MKDAIENDFRNLASTIERVVVAMALSYVEQNPEAASSDYVWEGAGMSLTAFQAGALAYVRLTGDAPDEVDEQAAIAFARTYAWGMAEAFRIAMVAISNPEAKGREADVLAAIRKGAKVRDALRVPSSSTSTAPNSVGATIIPFCPR